ncbi:riboflavin synthase [Bartonella sp. DGB2]|uniref:riboflavin synthase n=1 Tax=Bartonella sp. DGB2 TaxID=3388426 RepID=UPI00398FC04B
MFTGIITAIGLIEEIQQRQQGLWLKIKSPYPASTIDIGASIACSGICLTVIERFEIDGGGSYFIVEAWKEALQLTTISTWHTGQAINLERSLKLGDEMGGHLVSGHVDGRAQIIDIDEEGAAKRFFFKAPPPLAKFIAPKGSVALNGTSLTVNQVKGETFDILIIRHTLDVTTWNVTSIGEYVNLEVDQLARYVARLDEAKP